MPVTPESRDSFGRSGDDGTLQNKVAAYAAALRALGDATAQECFEWLLDQRGVWGTKHVQENAHAALRDLYETWRVDKVGMKKSTGPKPRMVTVYRLVSEYARLPRRSMTPQQLSDKFRATLSGVADYLESQGTPHIAALGIRLRIIEHERLFEVLNDKTATYDQVYAIIQSKGKTNGTNSSGSNDPGEQTGAG